jgi:trimeric autotransporter adhesin
MSTKTTFKRIALVAVAALGLGMLSVAPSTAAPQADSFTSATTSSTGVVNVAQTLNTTLSFISDTPTAAMTIASTVLTAPATAGALTVTGAVTASTTNTNTNYSSGLTVTSTAAGRTTAAVTLSFTPDKVGTYTIKLASAGGTNNQSITWTVVATDVAGVSATNSTVAMAASGSCSFSDGSWDFGNSACVGSNYPGIYSRATDTVTATASISNANSKVAGALIASFKLRQSNGASNTMVTTVPWTVAITSGPGNIQMGYVGRLVTAKSVTEGTTTSGNDGYTPFTQDPYTQAYFVSDGTTGKTVITFTAGGVLVATRTIDVYGEVATLTATQAKTSYPIGASAAGISVVAKDANGTVVPSVSIAAASATTTVATINTPVSTSNVGAAAAFDVTGVAAGTSVVTFTAGTITTTSTVTVGSTQSATLPTLTFDKAEYAAGELMTITVGAAAADNTAFVAFTALPVSSVNLITVKNPFSGGNTGTVALVGGKATWTAYAPLTSGPVVITATSGSGSSATAATVTATATVLSDGVAQAAVDAAAEAIDAANAATDAANAAAEAADAATAAAQDAADAVAALSVSVAAMIDALKKQITSLTNLVIKIQKKVKA